MKVIGEWKRLANDGDCIDICMIIYLIMRLCMLSEGRTYLCPSGA